MRAHNKVTVVKTLDIPPQVDFSDLGDKENGRLLTETETLLLGRVIAELPHQSDSAAERYSKKQLGELMAAYVLTHPELGIEWPVGKAATCGILKEPTGAVYAVYKGVKHSKELGAGAFGKVKLVQNISTGEWDVIKVQRYQALFSDIVTREHQALTNTGLSIGQIAKRNSSQTEEGEIEKHHFIMKYAKGGSLENFLISRAQLPVIQGLDIALQMTEEVYGFHQKGYLHCDIKPSNVVYDPVTGKVSIIDLGLATKMQNDEARPSVFGDAFFRAPEVGFLPMNHLTLRVPVVRNDTVNTPNTNVHGVMPAAVNSSNYNSSYTITDHPQANVSGAIPANSNPYNSDTVIDLPQANVSGAIPANSDPYNSDTVIDLPKTNVQPLGVYTPAADIYSLGISLAQLYGFFDPTGHPERINMQSSADANRALHDLVGSMINPNPALRPTLPEVKDQLETIREKVLPIYPKTIGIVQIGDYMEAQDKQAFVVALKSVDIIILADSSDSAKGVIDYSEIRRLLEKEGIAVSSEVVVSDDLVEIVSKVRELDQVKVSKTNVEDNATAVVSQICYVHSAVAPVSQLDGLRDITINVTAADRISVELDDEDAQEELVKVTTDDDGPQEEIGKASAQSDQPQVRNVILKLSEVANRLSSEQNYKDLKRVNDAIQRISTLGNTQQVSLGTLVTELSVLNSQFGKQSSNFFQSKTNWDVNKLIHHLQKEIKTSQPAVSEEVKIKHKK